MNRALFASAIAGVTLAAPIHPRQVYEGKFYDWLQEFKVEVKSGADFLHMLENFIVNHDIIETHNAKDSTYTLGHNQFSHLSFAEWKEHVRLGLAKPEETESPEFVHSAPADLSALPASVDWTSEGAVTAVKDQGQCGSCWSFSATGALEGAYEIKYGDLQSFSEQELVSCDTGFRKDHGCNGGLMDTAFSWVKSNGGLCSEADYPYTSGTTKENGDCKSHSSCDNTKLALSGYTDVTKNSDSALMSALAQQPVSVAIQADQMAFQLYKSGVFTEECGASLDHGVLAVGYGTLDGTDYYKVKNSWGSSWGMDGYILLERGVSQKEGQCGILSGPPSYPNIA